MTELHQRIITEARSWLGTRFSHQGRIKGVSVDCAGFIHGVAFAAKPLKVDDVGFILEIGEKLEIPNNYHRREDGVEMLRLLNEHLDFVENDDARPGDILTLCDPALREPDVPRHLVFVTEINPNLMIIHASERGVVEHRCNSHWKSRIHGCWRLREND